MVVLEQSREQALEKLRGLSKLYTKPSEEPDDPPKHKYTLRGVSTKHNITYVLERTKPNGITDILSSEASDWQWWKITFSAGDAKPISYSVCLLFFVVVLHHHHFLVMKLIVLPGCGILASLIFYSLYRRSEKLRF